MGSCGVSPVEASGAAFSTPKSVVTSMAGFGRPLRLRVLLYKSSIDFHPHCNVTKSYKRADCCVLRLAPIRPNHFPPSKKGVF